MPDVLSPLRIPGGAGAGRVLASDAAGAAAWSNPGLVSVKAPPYNAQGGADAPVALRPTSTITSDWITDAGTTHDVLNDVVTYPATPGGGATDYLFSATQNQVAEVKVPSTPLGTSPKTAVARAFIEINGSLTMELRRGTTVLATRSVTAGVTKWHSLTFPNIAQADVDDLRIRFIFNSTGGPYAAIYAAYVEIFNDDTAAFVSAIADLAAGGGGTLLTPNDDYGISDDVEFPANVQILGLGSLSTKFRCLNAAAGIRFGSGVVGGAFVNHNASQGFHVHGDRVSTYGLKISSTGGMFTDVMVTDVDGDCMTVLGQNCEFHRCITSDANLCGLVLDNGTGGNTFYNCHFNAATEWGIEIRKSGTPTAGAYPVPEFNYFYGGICEGSGSPTFGTTTAGKGAVRQTAGAYNYFTDWNVYITNPTSSVGFKLVPDGANSMNGRLYLRDCSWTGVDGAGQYGVEADAVSGGVAGGFNGDIAVIFSGDNIFSAMAAAIRWGTTTPVFNEGFFTLGVSEELVTNGTGAWSTVESRAESVSEDAPQTTVRVATTANHGLTGLAAIDGVTPIAADLVLVKNQSNGAQNGLYRAASGAWARDTAFDTSAEFVYGHLFHVSEGTTQSLSVFQLVTSGAITLGTTVLNFQRQSGPSKVGLAQDIQSSHTFTASATIAAGDAVMPSGNGTVGPCTVALNCIGIAVNGAANGQLVEVAGPGSVIQAKKTATSITTRGITLIATSTSGALAAGTTAGMIVGRILDSPGTATTCWLLITQG